MFWGTGAFWAWAKGHVVCWTHTLLRRELLNDHDDIFRRKRTFIIYVKWTKVYIDEKP